MQKIKITKIISLLIPILLITIILSCSPDSDIGKQPAAFNLQAANLYQSFSESELESNKKYVGKILELVGTIKAISEATDGTMVLILEANSTGDVQCNFTKEIHPKDLLKLKVGETILLKGICSGFLLDVMLDGCILI